MYIFHALNNFFKPLQLIFLPLVWATSKPSLHKILSSVHPVSQQKYHALFSGSQQWTKHTSCLKKLERLPNAQFLRHRDFDSGQEWRPGNLHFHNHLRWFWGRWYITHTLRNADLKHKLQTAGTNTKDLPWSNPQPALWLISHYFLPSQAPCSTQTGLLSESALLTFFTTWKCPSPLPFLIQNLFRLQMPTHSPTLALPTQLQMKLNANSIISILLMKHVLSHLY